MRGHGHVSREEAGTRSGGRGSWWPGAGMAGEQGREGAAQRRPKETEGRKHTWLCSGLPEPGSSDKSLSLQDTVGTEEGLGDRQAESTLLGSPARAPSAVPGQGQEACRPPPRAICPPGGSTQLRLSLRHRNPGPNGPLSPSFSAASSHHVAVCGESYLIARDVPVVRKRRGPGGFPAPELGPLGLFTPLTPSAEPEGAPRAAVLKSPVCPGSKGAGLAAIN